MGNHNIFVFKFLVAMVTKYLRESTCLSIKHNRLIKSRFMSIKCSVALILGMPFPDE